MNKLEKIGQLYVDWFTSRKTVYEYHNDWVTLLGTELQSIYDYETAPICQRVITKTNRYITTIC